MINRQLKNATLISYKDGTDEYGQVLTTPSKQEPISMTFDIFSHSQTDDVRYNQVTHFGLTKSAVDDSQRVIIDEKEYKVLFVQPHRMWNEVFLCQQL